MDGVFVGRDAMMCPESNQGSTELWDDDHDLHGETGLSRQEALLQARQHPLVIHALRLKLNPDSRGALRARIGQRADTGPEPGASGPDRGPGILARAGGMRTRTLALWSGFFLGYLALYFLMSWIPTLLVDAGLALDRSIYAGIALNVGGGIGMLALGHWSATRGLRPLIMGVFIAAALSMAVLGQLPLEIALLLPVTVVCGFFALGALIGLYSVAARIYPAAARASGVGWAIGAGRVGGILGPVIGGVLVELQWPTGWYFTLAAVPLLLATGAMAAIRARELAPGA